MSFHGKEICDMLDEKMAAGIWDKTDRDEQFLNKPINNDNLKGLAEAVAISRDVGALQKIKLAMEKLTGGAEEDAIRQVVQSVTRVSGALETVTSAKIDRLFVVSSSGRVADCESDVDMVAFVENLDAALENDLMTSVSTALRTVANNQPKIEGNCFCFTVNTVNICLALTYCVDRTADGQRKGAFSRLMTLDNQNKLTDDDLQKWSVSCAESQLDFYRHFAVSPNAIFYWNTIRLLKLWQRRNLPSNINPYLFEVIALKVADNIINSGQQPDLIQSLKNAFVMLSEPDKLNVHFDQYCQQIPARIGTKMPVVTNPVNCYTNLCTSVKYWTQIKESATNSLNAIGSARLIGDIFPPKTMKAKGA